MYVDVACVRASDVCGGLVLRVVFWGLPGFWRERVVCVIMFAAFEFVF